jgi:ABC-type antimicrobial peptide transport system permease subunit
MDDVVGASMAARKANTLLITLFGGLALLIAALGVYAVTSNAVAQRTREFGIRAALGATRSDLLRHVSGEIYEQESNASGDADPRLLNAEV